LLYTIKNTALFLSLALAMSFGWLGTAQSNNYSPCTPIFGLKALGLNYHECFGTKTITLWAGAEIKVRGNWVNDELSGSGTALFPNGDHFRGEWHADGWGPMRGVYTTEEGISYVGDMGRWRSNYRKKLDMDDFKNSPYREYGFGFDGRYKVTFPNGQREVHTFDRGNLLSKVRISTSGLERVVPKEGHCYKNYRSATSWVSEATCSRSGGIIVAHNGQLVTCQKRRLSPEDCYLLSYRNTSPTVTAKKSPTPSSKSVPFRFLDDGPKEGHCYKNYRSATSWVSEATCSRSGGIIVAHNGQLVTCQKRRLSPEDCYLLSYRNTSPTVTAKKSPTPSSKSKRNTIFVKNAPKVRRKSFPKNLCGYAISAFWPRLELFRNLRQKHEIKNPLRLRNDTPLSRLFTSLSELAFSWRERHC
jgi:hypothetical protein